MERKADPSVKWESLFQRDPAWTAQGHKRGYLLHMDHEQFMQRMVLLRSVVRRRRCRARRRLGID